MLTDDSIMPWGIHKGLKMYEVPDAYLLFLHSKKCFDDTSVMEYVEDNLEAIKSNVKNEERLRYTHRRRV